MRHLTTSLALPAVAAGIALLAGTAIAVGIMTSPTTNIPAAAASPPMGTEQMMPGMAMPRAGTPVSGQDVPVATNSIAIQNRVRGGAAAPSSQYRTELS
jgi:hypothetical protein